MKRAKGTVQAAEAVPTATVTAVDPLTQWIIDNLGRPREEVIAEIEEAAAKNPVLRNKLGEFRGFVEKCYDVLAGNLVEGLAEVLALSKTGSGPVVPDDVDLA